MLYSSSDIYILKLCLNMKVKKYFLTILVLTILVLISFFLFNSLQKRNSRKEEYKSLPVFELSDIHGKTINSKIWDTGRYTIFLFFDPECSMCTSEFKEIQSHLKELEHCQLVFFSTMPSDSIKNYLTKINFSEEQNMIFITDPNDFLTRKLEIKAPPTSLIYNKENVLIKRFDGSVKIETLIKYTSN